MLPDTITFKTKAGESVTVKIKDMFSIDDEREATLVMLDRTSFVICEEDTKRVFTAYVRSLKE